MTVHFRVTLTKQKHTQPVPLNNDNQILDGKSNLGQLIDKQREQ